VAQHIAALALVVADFDEALDFYVGKLGFELVEDTVLPLEPGKRWVRVKPPGPGAAHLLLARATTDAQRAAIGNQTGGRVFLFLHTDDFWRDYRAMQEQGIVFVRQPAEEPHGTVAVFEDLYGNKWDFIQPRG
jgi:catechol 2,3-dioxygenase-like lactoylglutathione lyase family enzyme